MSLMETKPIGGTQQQPFEAPAGLVASTEDETKPSALATQNRSAPAGGLSLVYDHGSRLDQTLAPDIAQFAGRFLLIPEPARWVLPVWILHTHIFDQFEFIF